jgi:ABC-type multidrug transport system fused ATPase/permease subunit
MLASQVQWVMRVVDRADNAMTSVERLLHFRSIASEPDGDSNSVNNWSPALEEIEFDDLCLRYRPELPLVLRGVSMRVVAGEKVGICGRTGAGKSSLMAALFRVCSFDSGRVLIDGVDVQRLKLRELRRGLAIIPQDPVLYSGTLRDNVDPFHEYSDEAIWAALRHVHLADLVADKRGGGLAFRVSDGGENLSVGQRQLLCISRALLKGSRIVVLDDATASVDSATDALIQVTIREAFADQTVLIIAHRIDTIMHCDKIVVMTAGRVAELASPAELLGRPDSIFASLVNRSATKTEGWQ